MVFEKYYFRNSSYTALTIQCIDNGINQIAYAIGTGGGEGLLNISLGSNKSIVRKAKDILKQHDFVECDMNK